MSGIDWGILCATLLLIVLYGLWKSHGTKNIEGYLLADRKFPWYHVGLSVMATQASAITFLAAPGQGYTDGLRFVQFYFGLPLAVIVLCVSFIPIFQRLNVYTAYEYLEKRFDTKTRVLTAALFLFQRGLSTGITIYAPAIVLSVILHLDIVYTTLFMGGIVILYTAIGGAKAISYTQLLQMFIIFAGLFITAYMVIHLLPQHVSFTDALHIAGKMGRLNAINTHFDVNDKFNIWSGIIGGFFLQLSYFGTDQSQVGRYLTGKSVTQSRLGLVMNGLVKIPMQFLILLIGTLVFTFYQFHQPPVFFNQMEIEKIQKSEYREAYQTLQQEYNVLYAEKQQHVNDLVDALHTGDENRVETVGEQLKADDGREKEVREAVRDLVKKNDEHANKDDGNYIFLNFVTHHLPQGVVGLLMAVIFLAFMGSMASALNSLTSTTVVDFYKRFGKKQNDERKELRISKWTTIGWGLFCVVVALFASRVSNNLIEAVNVLGSFFYGTILGIFMVAFYMKNIRGTAVFYAALAAEVFVVFTGLYEVAAFLWLNVIGCLLVMGLAWGIEMFLKNSGAGKANVKSEI